MTATLPSSLEQGDGIVDIVVGVQSSVGYQKATAEATITFGRPRLPADVTQAVDEATRLLEAITLQAAEREAGLAAEADRRVKDQQPAWQPPAQQAATPSGLVPRAAVAPAQDADVPFDTGQPAAAPAPAAKPWEQQAQAPAQAPAADTGGWVQGNRRGKGKIDYLPTSVLSEEDFRGMVTAEVVAQTGFPAEQIRVFDNRVGNFGLEKGKANNTVGKVVAARDTDLNRYLQQKTGGDLIAWVAFNKPDFTPQVDITDDVKDAAAG